MQTYTDGDIENEREQAERAPERSARGWYGDGDNRTWDWGDAVPEQEVAE